MPRLCNFCNFAGEKRCRKVASLYMLSSDGVLKIWYCVEHYDRMAAYYTKCWNNDVNDDWSRNMVKNNGW